MNRLLPLLALSVAPLSAGDFTITRTDDRISVRLDESLFTEHRTDSRVPYLYPLPSPSGACLTRHWPMDDSFPEEERDHPHHRSFWMSHGEVNGHDFWAWKFGKDPKIELKSVGEISEDSFTVHLAWTAGGDMLLNDERTYRFIKPDEKTVVIEFTSKLTAAADEVTFGDTKEGFFALRVDRTLRTKGPHAKGSIVDSEGRKDGDCWGKRSNWVAFTGPDEKGEPAVIAVLDHPSNLRHPTWWHARDYGLLAANPFGIHDFEPEQKGKPGRVVLKKGESLTFRYGIVLHHGDAGSADLAERWKKFSGG